MKNATYNPVHDADNPDHRPGDYFVSAVDGPEFSLVSGPYASHAEALAKLAPARRLAMEYDTRAAFYGFGTCRFAEGSGRVGVLEKNGVAV